MVYSTYTVEMDLRMVVLKDIMACAEQFERIIHKYNQSEYRKISYGEGLFLSRKEIHTVVAVGKNRDINITELAKLQGVTKGAVSQMVYKLVDKGLLVKVPSPDSDAEIHLELTELGQKAFQEHEKYHKETQDEFFTVLRDLPEESFNKMVDLLEVFENMLDKDLSV